MSMNESCLKEAFEILNGSRDADYGDAVMNFEKIADIASSILGYEITPVECVVTLISLKLSREMYKHKKDNIIDCQAYLEILNMIKEKED
jgi:hypothetical protein